MITKRENTLFEGLFPLPEKYIKQARKHHEDLWLSHGSGEMVIKWQDINKLIVKWSAGHHDHWSGKLYSLAYFKFEPMTYEEALEQKYKHGLLT
jgi:hypothetical protein